MSLLKIHSLYHVDFEKLGYIETWVTNKGYSVTTTRLNDNDELPDQQSFDWLIIMGGLMGVYDEAHYPWLVAEKQFIKQSIAAGKTVIAECLGAKVAPSGGKEIGWMPIELTKKGKKHPLLQDLPKQALN